jgi:DNA-binding transcriptional ArsR family regulator
MQVACLQTASEAAALLAHPLRLEVIRAAREPISSTEIASRIGQPRQKVNYHVRELARARLLKRAGQRVKRNLLEKRWVATAQAYVFSPDLLGDAQPDPAQFRDQFSAEFLLANASKMQAQLGTVLAQAAQQKKRIATLGLSAEFAFESAAQREAFTHALFDAVAAAIAKHTVPVVTPHARPFRLTLGCYPIPKESS